MRGKIGGRSRCTRAVDMEDEDDEGSALGNQSGLHQGVAEEHPNCNDQQLSQPGHLMERGNPSARTHQSTLRNGKRDVLSDGR